jgi:hypothetical protein
MMRRCVKEGRGKDGMWEVKKVRSSESAKDGR